MWGAGAAAETGEVQVVDLEETAAVASARVGEAALVAVVLREAGDNDATKTFFQTSLG